MAHPAEIARQHIMTGLEACQSNSGTASTLEMLTQCLAKAQSKLFPAIKLEPTSPAAVDMMRRAMEHLAQALKTLQDINDGGEAVSTAASSIAKSLQTLHPIVDEAKEQSQKIKVDDEPPSEERRDTLDVDVQTMLSMSTDHNFYTSFSENIEEGGIFVATFDPKPIEARVVVNFKLPGNRHVSVRGTVHWVREYNPMSPEVAPGMGVKFTEIEPGDQKAIEEYLKQRDPLFYDDDL